MYKSHFFKLLTPGLWRGHATAEAFITIKRAECSWSFLGHIDLEKRDFYKDTRKNRKIQSLNIWICLLNK